MFKIIPNTNERYEANEFGEIKRVLSLVANNTNGGRRTIGKKPLSQKTKSNGYKEVALYLKEGGKSFYVHRLVASTFISEIPNGYVVNHKDGNKSNNNVSNLEIVTYSQNSKHSHHVLNNKAPIFKGEKHGMSKLKEDDIKQIRLLHKTYGFRFVVNKYNFVHKSTITKIVSGIAWKHIF